MVVDAFLLAERRRDFALTVQGTRVYVNRHYLADMSAVFDKLFFPDTGFDAPADGLPLKDKTLDDFLEVLHCVCPAPTIKKIDEPNVLLMLSFADEYEMDDLKQRCVDCLLDQLRADFAQCRDLNVHIALKACEDFRLTEVRASCVDYMTRQLMADSVDGQCIADFLQLAHTYNLEAVRDRCVSVMNRHLNIGDVDQKVLVGYLRLAVAYRFVELTKRLVPRVAQLDFAQLKFQAAHTFLPPSVLAAIYQQKARDGSREMELAVKIQKVFECGSCHKAANITNLDSHTELKSACCGATKFLVRRNADAPPLFDLNRLCCYACCTCEQPCSLGQSQSTEKSSTTETPKYWLTSCGHMDVRVYRKCRACAAFGGYGKPMAKASVDGFKMVCSRPHGNFSVDLLKNADAIPLPPRRERSCILQ